MGRKLRVEYPGAIYHLMNRGDRREPIFDDDLHRQRFLRPGCGWRRIEAEPQVRPSEDRAGGAVAAGNDDDAQMDCGTLADGSLDALEQTVV